MLDSFKIIATFSCQKCSSWKIAICQREAIDLMTHNTCQLCRTLETIFVKIVSSIDSSEHHYWDWWSSTSCHTCGNFAGFLKTSEINQLFYLSLFRLALFKSQLTSKSIDLTPHVPTLSDSWNKFVSKLCQTSINSSNHHYWGWLSTSWHACQLCMILENVWHQSTLPPVIII